MIKIMEVVLDMRNGGCSRQESLSACVIEESKCSTRELSSDFLLGEPADREQSNQCELSTTIENVPITKDFTKNIEEIPASKIINLSGQVNIEREQDTLSELAEIVSLGDEAMLDEEITSIKDQQH